MNIRLECLECKKNYSPSSVIYKCHCGGTLDVLHDLDSLKKQDLKALFEERYASKKLPYSSGVWRYKELVLPIEDDFIVSRNEGNTNLYSSNLLHEFTGAENILLKHEGENPTGSFKDRGMTTGISIARYLERKIVVCASTGNTSASMASYAATGGLTSLIFIPDGEIAFGKLSQALAYGGKCFQIKGDFDSAMNLVFDIAEKLGIYLLNSVNPFRIEGQKTIIFEALQQMDWEVPDWIVLPGGNLGNSSAAGKAIKELFDLGIIDKMPRIAVIQAQGANPFYSYYKNGFQQFDPVKADTLATAIKIGNPVSHSKCKRGIKWTGGIVEQLTEEEIIRAKAVVDASGIGAEPASCCTVGGIKKLIEAGIISKQDKILGILTGHILKDPDTTVDYHTGALESPQFMQNRPVKIDPKTADFFKIISEELQT